MKIGKLEDFISVEETGKLLQKFATPLNASSMVWDEEGNLRFVDFVTPFCEEVYSCFPEKCEADRKERFERAKREKKPFLHQCFAQKLNYVIPLIVKINNDVYFLGVAGG